MKKIQTIHLESVDSTNNWAKEHKASFSPEEITCITANYQTEGKGRAQKKWIATKDENILATFYFRLHNHLSTSHQLPLILALSLCLVLEKHDLHPQIKWPNDILLQGKKFSGILCETSLSATYADIFLGIGINVNMQKDMIAQITQPATSLFLETKKTWDLQELLHSLQEIFQKNLSFYMTKDFSFFLSDINKRLAYKNTKLQFHDGKNTWIGYIDSLSSDGALQFLLEKTKEIKTFYSGQLLTL